MKWRQTKNRGPQAHYNSDTLERPGIGMQRRNIGRPRFPLLWVSLWGKLVA